MPDPVTAGLGLMGADIRAELEDQSGVLAIEDDAAVGAHDG